MEPLLGYLQLAEKLSTRPELADGWNFGPEYQDSRSVEWIANSICQLWGDAASWQCDEQSHPHEAGILRLDCSKSRSLLGWQPRLDLGGALTLTTDWYRACQAQEDMRSYTLRQLDAYRKMEIV
jgi:CDP-glucose 4,6-dehydratase